MKTHQESALKSLSHDEILCVGGSGAPSAQDMYGNTVSMEEYMDLQLLAANTGDASVIFDFYEKGVFDSDKPNIYHQR